MNFQVIFQLDDRKGSFTNLWQDGQHSSTTSFSEALGPLQNHLWWSFFRYMYSHVGIIIHKHICECQCICLASHMLAAHNGWFETLLTPGTTNYPLMPTLQLRQKTCAFGLGKWFLSGVRAIQSPKLGGPSGLLAADPMSGSGVQEAARGTQEPARGMESGLEFGKWCRALQSFAQKVHETCLQPEPHID